MAIIVPDSGSIYAAEASVPNSIGHWAWLGFQPNAGASGGSMIWFMGTAASNGSPLLPIVVASANQPTMWGPIVSPSTGWFAASVTGGSAIIWMKSAS